MLRGLIHVSGSAASTVGGGWTKTSQLRPSPMSSFIIPQASLEGRFPIGEVLKSVESWTSHNIVSTTFD